MKAIKLFLVAFILGSIINAECVLTKTIRPNLLNAAKILTEYLVNNDRYLYHIDRALLYYENNEYIWFFSIVEPDIGWSFFLVDRNKVTLLSGERLTEILTDLNIRDK